MKNFFTLDCIPTIYQMLPQSYRDRYQNFQLVLEQLQLLQRSCLPVSGLEDNPAAANTKINPASLKEAFSQVQEFFGHQIATLSADELDPAIAPRVQSYLTEINKQLQLLAIDVAFLQASRQPATLQARITQIGSRLETLIAYCQAILQTE